MVVDVVISAIFAALVFLGWRSGALRQVIRVVALVAVVVASPFVAQVLREAVLLQTELAAPVTEAGLLFAAGTLIYFSVSLAGWLAVKVMRAASDTLGNMDRAGGAGLGAVKGGAIVYLLVFTALFLEVPLSVVDPDDKLHMRNGHATTFVKQYNVLAPWHLPEVDAFHDVIVVAHLVEEQNKHEMIRDDAVASEVLRDEKLDEILNNDALVEAAKADYFHVTLADSDARALINDSDFQAKVALVDWKAFRASMESQDSAPKLEVAKIFQVLDDADLNL